MEEGYLEPEDPTKRPIGANPPSESFHIDDGKKAFGFHNKPLDDEPKEEEIEQPLPCKHEWKQYFERPQKYIHGVYCDMEKSTLKENGFFCIHCLERRQK